MLSLSFLFGSASRALFVVVVSRVLRCVCFLLCLFILSLVGLSCVALVSDSDKIASGSVSHWKFKIWGARPVLARSYYVQA